jgi:cytoskeletal protein CcmA (bactofilin family)
VIVGGRVDGNITALHSLEILPGARVHGDIKSSVLSVGEGAAFEGSCIMDTVKDALTELKACIQKKPA